ncbi:hypothetical protein SC979_09260 [Legionella pneumophila serogroup 1]
MMEGIFIGGYSSNQSHMPHPYRKGWGRLKLSSEAPVPNAPFVP